VFGIVGLKEMREPRKENRGSLHSAPPDFLLSFVALMKFLRLSLRRAACVVVTSFARQEIRVRSVEKKKNISPKGP
jgi:hypothetical protein